MNQVKIGKFIAERRKALNLTQMQLAEKLFITDRAISKWETGKSMPDSSIMLKLCDVLNISVNDLLHGEVIDMNEKEKKMEEQLIEMVKQKEEADRRLLKMEIVIGILSVLIISVPAIIAGYLSGVEEWMRILISLSGFIPGFAGMACAMKIEQVAGYYECPHCRHRYVPTTKAIWFSAHIGRTRKMRCPECGTKNWHKKVVTKN